MAVRFMVNRVGERYGKLVVVRFLYSKSRTEGKRKHRHYLCKCDCGKEKIVTIGDLRQGSTSSCGCSRKRFNDMPARQTYQVYQTRADKNGMPLELTFEDFKRLCEQNCYYCDKAPSNKSIYRHTKEFYLYNGLDRVDNTKGYVLKNCVPCCDVCNKAKRDMTCIEFIQWIHAAHRNLYVTTPEKSEVFLPVQEIMCESNLYW